MNCTDHNLLMDFWYLPRQNCTRIDFGGWDLVWQKYQWVVIIVVGGCGGKFEFSTWETRIKKLCLHVLNSYIARYKNKNSFWKTMYLLSPYRLGTFDRIVKNNMPAKLFFFSIIIQFFCIVHTYFVPGGVAIGPMTYPDQKPSYQGCLSCMSSRSDPCRILRRNWTGLPG